MSGRYSVWSVGKDGNVMEHGGSDHADLAVALCRGLGKVYGGPKSGFRCGITDNEDGTEVTQKLEEDLMDTPHKVAK